VTFPAKVEHREEQKDESRDQSDDISVVIGDNTPAVVTFVTEIVPIVVLIR
jgi:hypothetical protein